MIKLVLMLPFAIKELVTVILLKIWCKVFAKILAQLARMVSVLIRSVNVIHIIRERTVLFLIVKAM